MNGIECLGEFHIFFPVCFVCLFVLPWNYGSLKEKKKKQVFPHLISYLSTPPP